MFLYPTCLESAQASPYALALTVVCVIFSCAYFFRDNSSECAVFPNCFASFRSLQAFIAQRAAQINQISGLHMKFGTSAFSTLRVRPFPHLPAGFRRNQRSGHGAAVASGRPLSTIQVETAVPPSSPGTVDRLCTAPLTLKKLSPALRILSGWPRVWSTNTPLST